MAMKLSLILMSIINLIVLYIINLIVLYIINKNINNKSRDNKIIIFKFVWIWVVGKMGRLNKVLMRMYEY